MNIKSIFKLLIVLFCFAGIQCSGECRSYHEVGSGYNRGIADENGNIVLEQRYYTVKDLYSHDRFKVCRSYENDCGIYDARDRKFIIPTIYSSIDETDDGYIVKRWSKYGFIDDDGFSRLSIDYDSIREEDSGLKLEKSGYYGYADRHGNILLNCQYDDLSVTKNGLIVSLNSLYGVYSQYNASEIIPIKYSYITSDGNGFILNLYGKYGYANSIGAIIADVKYDALESRGDILIVELSSGLGVLTNGGVTVLDCIYDSIAVTETGYIIQQNNKQGFANKQGSVVLPCIYNKISEKTNTYAKLIHKLIGYDLKQGDFMGFADIHGNIILPCEYNYIEPKYNFPWFWKSDIKVSYDVIKNYKKYVIYGIMDKDTKTVKILPEKTK